MNIFKGIKETFDKGISLITNTNKPSILSSVIKSNPQFNSVAVGANLVGSAILNQYKANLNRINSNGGLLGDMINTPIFGDPNLKNTPTWKNYISNQVYKPVSTGVKEVIQNPSIGGKALGGLGVLGGAWSASPIGFAYNLGTGGLAGVAETIRKGGDLNLNMKNAIENPTSIARTGFGVGEKPINIGGMNIAPILAMGIDVGITHNPKSIVKNSRNISGLVNDFKNVANGNKSIVWKEALADWINTSKINDLTGYEAGKKFNVDPKEGWNIIKEIENPNTTKLSENGKSLVDGFKMAFEDAYQELKKINPDVGYWKNYITHIWNNSDEEIAKALSANKRVGGRRFVKSYEEGIALGLTPKYESPNQILAEYITNIEKVKSNITFLNKLKEQDIVSLYPRAGFKQISAKGFPNLKDEHGNIINYFAPDEVANTINRIFEPDTSVLAKTLGITGGISSKAQDWSMAGGVSSLNAFALDAGLQRSYLAGRFGSGTKAFIKSFDRGGTTKEFEENIPIIKEMAQNGLNLPHTLSIDNLKPAKNFIEKHFGNSLGEAWDRTFSEPTFNRMFGLMQLDLYKDIKARALSGTIFNKAVDEAEAQKIATKAVQMFHASTSIVDEATANKNWENTLSTAFFANKYRRSVINFYINNLKAISPIGIKEGKLGFNNPLALENETNTKFVLGSVAQWLLMDKMNYKLWGRHLNENPRGMEDQLLIPASVLTGNEEDNTIIKIPFLPSLGYVPRTVGKIIKHSFEGDTKALKQDVSGIPSILGQTGLSLLNNENYFGQPIFGDKGIGAARYVYQQLNHPVMELVNDLYGIPFPNVNAKGKSTQMPTYQALSKFFELPLKYSTTDKVNSAYYYQNKDDVIKTLNAEDKGVFDSLNGKTTEEKTRIRLENPRVLEAETHIAQATSKMTGEPLSPFYQLPTDFQALVLFRRTLAEDQKKVFDEKNKEFLQSYWKANDIFYKDKEIAGQEKVDPKLQAKIEAYYSIPSGTGERTKYLENNSDVKDYFDEQRKKKGLPPFQPFAKKPRNRFASLRNKKIKVKVPKINQAKFKDLKIKWPKVKKQVAIKPPKLKIKFKEGGSYV